MSPSSKIQTHTHICDMATENEWKKRNIHFPSPVSFDVEFFWGKCIVCAAGSFQPLDLEYNYQCAIKPTKK